MKKILLPIDGAKHSSDALHYAVMMSGALEDVVFSLFHVQPFLSEYVVEEAKKNPEANKKLKELQEKNAESGTKILQQHKEHLIRSGVAEERIELLTRQRREGVAKDIIQKARSEYMDAIVMGRRGLSRLQETFIGSTTKNVIEHNADIPVWVVDGQISSQNILLAVDGSTSSAKALDHLVDIMHPNPEAELTIFHVQPSLKDTCGIDFNASSDAQDQEAVTKIVEHANRQCMDNFMQHARGRLKEKAFDENQVNFKTQPVKRNIGKAIADEFKQGDYGTVVVGKRGINKRFFMGSVSSYLISHLTDAALWIVP
ncbi:MAG: universal stress protein [Desulfobacterales bacterium]